jgi:hypothetical protein
MTLAELPADIVCIVTYSRMRGSMIRSWKMFQPCAACAARCTLLLLLVRRMPASTPMCTSTSCTASHDAARVRNPLVALRCARHIPHLLTPASPHLRTPLWGRCSRLYEASALFCFNEPSHRQGASAESRRRRCNRRVACSFATPADPWHAEHPSAVDSAAYTPCPDY